jgi:predicted dienelactone hydrolase
VRGWPSALAAQRLTLAYGLLERSISLDDLIDYADTGALDDELYVYIRYIKPEQRELLRRSLRLKSDLSVVAVAQFLYSPQGQILLQRLGEVIQPESRQNGLHAIRAALILAAADPEGLTPINVLRQFPTAGIRIDLQKSLRIAAALDELITQTNRVSRDIAQQVERESVQQALPNPLLNLTLPGPISWVRRSLTLEDRDRIALSGFVRIRPVALDLYTPNIPLSTKSSPKLPVVVISHGLGSDRASFRYLAEYLASHGYVVLVPAHPGSDANQLAALLRGWVEEVAEPLEFIDRPLDVKFILDRLAADGRFNDADWNNVGVVGQSFGGYTALVLAGAQLNFDQLSQECSQAKQLTTLNVSVFLQCRAAALPRRQYQIADPRVKAIVAVNPVSSLVFGPAGLAQIRVPTMMIAGQADTVTPALLEQIRPFTWLTTPDRYLVLVDRSTHFSFLGESQATQAVPLQLPPEVIGPSPRMHQRYLEVLSFAFFRTYLQQQAGFKPYLSGAYTRGLSQDSLRVDLLQSLDPAKLGRSPK